MKKIAIIGGGLAGTACAYILKQAGVRPVIYEAGASLAAGASGNEIGLYNPRISAEHSPQTDYYIQAFERALKTFEDLSDIDFNPCGALHLINDEKKQVRYAKTVQSWPWPQEDLRIVPAGEASQIAGVALEENALYIRRSGFVSPRKLCQAYAQGIEVHLNTPINDLGDLSEDMIILANGHHAAAFPGAAHLPLKPVRGQVTLVEATQISSVLKTNVCYGGYISAPIGGRHVVGSTFQRWLDHSDILPEDDADNLEKLEHNVPILSGSYNIVGQRAAVRTTAPDHMPVVGALSERIYISSAHGSHGILSSLMAAHILSAQITDKDLPLDHHTIECVSPGRYDNGGGA